MLHADASAVEDYCKWLSLKDFSGTGTRSLPRHVQDPAPFGDADLSVLVEHNGRSRATQPFESQQTSDSPEPASEPALCRSKDQQQG